MLQRRKGKKVTWKTDGDASLRTKPGLRPHPLVACKVNDADFEGIREHLVAGALFTTKTSLSIDHRFDIGYKQHTYRYLYESFNLTPQFLEGTGAVYAGETRVDEMNVHGEMIRPVRHMFLIGGTIYMVTSPEKLFTPVQD